MKKRILLLFFAIFSSACLMSQSFKWARSYDATGGLEWNDIQKTDSGFVLAGSFGGQLQWNGQTLTSNGGKDLLIATVDSLGDPIAAFSFGSTSDDEATAVIESADKQHYYLSGSFNNSFTLNGTTYTERGIGECILVKFDKQFQIARAVSFGSEIASSSFLFTERVNQILEQSNEIILRCNFFQSGINSIRFFYNNSSIALNAAPWTNIGPPGLAPSGGVIKIDKNSFTFLSSFGDNQSAISTTKIEESVNTYWLTSEFPFVGFGLYLYSLNQNNLSLDKVSDTIQRISSSQTPFVVSGLLSSQDNIFVSGSFSGAYEIGNGQSISFPGINLALDYSNTAAFMAVADSSGKFQQLGQFSIPNSNSHLLGILDDGDKVIGFGGYSSGISFNNSIVFTNPNGQNGFVASIDENLNVDWAKDISSPLYVEPRAGVHTPGGKETYLAGAYTSSAEFDNTTLNSASGNANSGFIALLSCEPIQPPPVIGDTVVCTGPQTYRLDDPDQGVQFSWTLSSGGSLASSNDQALINWDTPGRHRITITTTNPCGTSQARTVFVNVLEQDTGQPITGDSITCVNTLKTYSLPLLPEVSYVWSLSGGGNLITFQNSAVVQWNTPGTYTISALAVSSCGTWPTDTLTVSVKSLPPSPGAIAGPSVACAGPAQYTLSGIDAGDSVQWALSSGGTLSLAGKSALIDWTSPGQHVLTGTVLNECGLGPSRSLTVNVLGVPSQPSGILGNASTCIGTQSYTIIGEPGVTHTWSISGGGLIASQNNTFAQINWTQPGTYTVRVTPSTVCGTGTPATLTVSVSGTPARPGEIRGLDTVCLGTQSYQVPASSGSNYIWSLNGGGNLTTNGRFVDVDWTSPGTYTLQVVPVSNCGIGPSRSLTVFVRAQSSALDSISGTLAACLGNVESYAVPANPSITYTWSLDSGGVLTASGNSATVTWQKMGEFTLRVNSSDGCSRSITVEVKDLPEKTPIQGSALSCIGTQSSFFVNARAEETYQWSLSSGGSLNAFGSSASIAWTTVGVHQLILTPQNLCGDGISDTLEVEVGDRPAQPFLSTWDSLACLGSQVARIGAFSNDNIYSVQLSGGGAVDQSGDSITLSWNTPGIHFLTIRATNRCGTSTTRQYRFRVGEPPVVPRIESPSSACALEPFLVSIRNRAPEDSYRFMVSGASYTLDSLSPDTIRVTPLERGVIRLDLIAENRCGTTPSNQVVVSVDSLPIVADDLLGPDSLCIGIVDYTYPSNTTGLTFDWSVSLGGQILSNNGSGIRVNWTRAGQQQVTCIVGNQCGTGDTITFGVKTTEAPPSPFPIQGEDTSCRVSQVYQVTLPTGISGTWQVSAGGQIDSSRNDTAWVTWQQAGSQSIRFVPFNGCGNGPSSQLNVVVVDPPTVPVFAITGSACTGDTLLVRITNFTPSIRYAFSISGVATLDSLAPDSFLLLPQQSGRVQVGLEAENFCGTTSSINQSIQIGQRPSGNGTISGPDTVCPGFVTLAYLPADSGVQYLWEEPVGGRLINSTANTVTFELTSTGANLVSLQLRNGCGDSDTIIKTIFVRRPPRLLDTLIGPKSSCKGTTTYFALPDSGTSGTWTLRSGGLILSSSKDSVVVDWQQPGNHRIDYTPSTICANGLTNSITVSVKPPPTGLQIQGPSDVCPSDTSSYRVIGWEPVDSLVFISNASFQGFDSATASLLVVWGSNGDGFVQAIQYDECGQTDSANFNSAVAFEQFEGVELGGPDTLCIGQTGNFRLLRSDNLLPNWSSGTDYELQAIGANAGVTPVKTGTIVIRASVSSDCGRSISLQKDVFVKENTPTPSVELMGDSLTVVPAVPSVWYFNGEEISRGNASIPLQESGSYQAALLSDCGVGERSTEVNIKLGDLSQGDILLYPNPTDGLAKLEFPLNVVWKEIRVLDATGKELSKLQYTGSNLVALDYLSARGVYIVVIEVGDQRFNKRLVVR